ncbi:MAG TPA: transcriptional regulator [Myxococcales bacterium]|jgi:polyhydroxyalkanoate synthesis repressor PhaR|nr:transcriptional regulator [Myxococcales bacterium]
MIVEDRALAEQAGKEPKIIKRYSNRKLYDTEESRYVTLDEISEMVKAGADVKIVDNRSKEDLTSVTLAQIIFEEEKKSSHMPLSVLRDIIRSGGETLSVYLHSSVEHVGQRVASIREEAEVIRDRLLHRDGERQAVEAEAVPAAAPGAKPKTIGQAKELVVMSQRVLEDWQKRVDERVRDAVENLTSLPALARDMAALEKRIRELEKRLDEAEKSK